MKKYMERDALISASRIWWILRTQNWCLCCIVQMRKEKGVIEETGDYSDMGVAAILEILWFGPYSFYPRIWMHCNISFSLGQFQYQKVHTASFFSDTNMGSGFIYQNRCFWKDQYVVCTASFIENDTSCTFYLIAFMFAGFTW